MPDAATTATATTTTTGSTGGDGGAATAGATQAGAATQANGQAAGAGATSAATNQAAGATGKTANATLMSGDAKGDQKPDANATTTGDQKDGKATGDKPYELKLPEGAQLDAEAVKAVAAEYQKLGIPADVAQKVFERELSAVRNHTTASQERWTKQTQQWAEAVKTDKDIGGDKLKATIDVAKRALARADDDKGTLRQLLEETGLGNHPAVIRAFHKLGRDMGEDNFAGKTEQTAGNDEEASLRKRYPTMFANG